MYFFCIWTIKTKVKQGFANTASVMALKKSCNRNIGHSFNMRISGLRDPGCPICILICLCEYARVNTYLRIEA